MDSAKFCYNCGQRFGDGERACLRCLLPRRTVPLAARAAQHAQPPFVWTWCHFFRNALCLGAAVCLLAAMGDDSHNQSNWLLGMAALGLGAFAFHRFHANVCMRGKFQTRD